MIQAPPPGTLRKPDELARGDFEMVVRRLADDLAFGADNSLFVGGGLEYAGSRPYQPGDPVRMATRIIESVDVEPAPMRVVLGSQALQSTIDALKRRIEGFEAQRDLAASTDFPAGE